MSPNINSSLGVEDQLNAMEKIKKQSLGKKKKNQGCSCISRSKNKYVISKHSDNRISRLAYSNIGK